MLRTDSTSHSLWTLPTHNRVLNCPNHHEKSLTNLCLMATVQVKNLEQVHLMVITRPHAQLLTASGWEHLIHTQLEFSSPK